MKLIITLMVVTVASMAIGCSYSEGNYWTGYYRSFLRTTSGKKCVYPFQYGNEKIYGCTTKGNDGVPWCATSYGSCREYGNWDNCRATASPGVMQISKDATISGFKLPRGKTLYAFLVGGGGGGGDHNALQTSVQKGGSSGYFNLWSLEGPKDIKNIKIKIGAGGERWSQGGDTDVTVNSNKDSRGYGYIWMADTAKGGGGDGFPGWSGGGVGYGSVGGTNGQHGSGAQNGAGTSLPAVCGVTIKPAPGGGYNGIAGGGGGVTVDGRIWGRGGNWNSIGGGGGVLLSVC